MDGLIQAFKKASIKTSTDLRTVAALPHIHQLSQLPLPEIERISHEVARVVPAGASPMSLTPAFLDELRSRTLLSALIGRTTKLQKAGREWKACCPFHNEKSPSFYVNDDKSFYHCLAAETIVMTKRGRSRIADLAGNTVDVLGPSGRWIAAPFVGYGTQRLWEIDIFKMS